MVRSQLNLFGAETSAVPAGFKYEENVVTAGAEETLVSKLHSLSFSEFKFHGYKGKRRVVSFGWKYDFNDRKLLKADDIPDFLLSLRTTAAAFSNLQPDCLQQVLVTEYTAGAGIGWHKDKPVFGEVVGISLVAPCVFRLRRKGNSKWERYSLTASPRSAYLLSGPARWEWEHSIPAVGHLRYSVTYRNFKQ